MSDHPDNLCPACGKWKSAHYARCWTCWQGSMRRCSGCREPLRRLWTGGYAHTSIDQDRDHPAEPMKELSQ